MQLVKLMNVLMLIHQTKLYCYINSKNKRERDNKNKKSKADTTTTTNPDMATQNDDNYHQLLIQSTVFLGGSCNPTTWRKDLAIPMLEALNISYYDPQKDHWEPELIELENKAKKNADVLFFVINNQTRAIAAMIEVSFLAATTNKLILVIDLYPTLKSIINNETISPYEHEILKNGRNLLRKLVERKGMPVFNQIPAALSYIPLMIEKNSPLSSTSSSSASFLTSTTSISLLTKQILSSSCFFQPDGQYHSIGSTWHPFIPSFGIDKCTLCTCQDLLINNVENKMIKDIFLAGSDNPKGWRSDIAIPLIEKSGLTYSMPKVKGTSSYESDSVKDDLCSLECCRVLLFVIGGQSPELETMILASHYFGQRYKVCLCIQPIPEESIAKENKISQTAINDYNRGRAYLSEMARKENIHVCDNLEKAVKCAITLALS